jgi:hypothetical protein
MLTQLRRRELSVSVAVARSLRCYRNPRLLVVDGIELGKMESPLPNPAMEKAEARGRLGNRFNPKALSV